MNNRKHERTDCQTEATIHYHGEAIRGVVENLSLKGLFVKTDQKIAVDEKVGISVHFYGADADLSFNLQATVVRAAENGLGFGFQKIDVNSLALQKKEAMAAPPA